jgi:hypothetical protein
VRSQPRADDRAVLTRSNLALKLDRRRHRVPGRRTHCQASSSASAAIGTESARGEPDQNACKEAAAGGCTPHLSHQLPHLAQNGPTAIVRHIAAILARSGMSEGLEHSDARMPHDGAFGSSSGYLPAQLRFPAGALGHHRTDVGKTLAAEAPAVHFQAWLLLHAGAGRHRSRAQRAGHHPADPLARG